MLEQEKVDLDGINAYRFFVDSQALQTNTTFNLGFCIEVEPQPYQGTWDTCPKRTDDPEILDLTDCGLPERVCPNGKKTMVEIKF